MFLFAERREAFRQHKRSQKEGSLREQRERQGSYN
jgi:hypothetical protein